MTCLGLAAVLPREVTEAFIPLLADEVERTDPLEEERFSFDEGRRSSPLLPLSLLPRSLTSRPCRLPALSRLPNDRPVLWLLLPFPS